MAQLVDALSSEGRCCRFESGHRHQGLSDGMVDIRGSSSANGSSPLGIFSGILAYGTGVGSNPASGTNAGVAQSGRRATLIS